MKYVDSDTMIAFKNKILDKLESEDDKRQPKIDKHVDCILGNLLVPGDFSNPLFSHASLYKEGKTYSWAYGTSSKNHDKPGHYFYRGNGNGVKALQTDYLHQRKRYDGPILDSERKEKPDMEDLFRLLIGNDLFEECLKGIYTLEDSNLFPKTKRPTHSIVFTFQENYDSFLQSLTEATESNMSNELVAKPSDPGKFVCYRGKIYLVENAFERIEGDISTKFCERVFGYLHIIVSINQDDDRTKIWVSTLRD